jgi:hypothetical protein
LIVGVRKSVKMLGMRERVIVHNHPVYVSEELTSAVECDSGERLYNLAKAFLELRGPLFLTRASNMLILSMLKRTERYWASPLAYLM